MAGRGGAERLTRRSRSARCATDRELAVVEAVLATGSEKAAAHRLGLSHSTVKHHLANARSKTGAVSTAQLVWILAQRLPDPEAAAQPDDSWVLPDAHRPSTQVEYTWLTPACPPAIIPGDDIRSTR